MDVKSVDPALIATLQQATMLHQGGRLREAEDAYLALIRRQPSFTPASLRLGILYRTVGRYEEARRLLDHAAAQTLAPEPLIELGLTLDSMGRFEDALNSYDRALRLAPDNPAAINNRGNTLMKLKRASEALECYDRAIGLKPDYANAYSNRSNALLALHRPDDARRSCERAISLNWQNAFAHNNHGLALLRLGRASDALRSFDQAISLNGNYANAFANRGHALTSLKRPDQAQQSFERALALQPGHPEAFSGAAIAALQSCDWSAAAGFARLMPQHILDGMSQVNPFVSLCYGVGPDLQLVCARNWAARYQPPSAEAGLPAPLPRSSGGKIRLGYVSGDFHNHAVAVLIAELFELHDRDRFELVGFSFGPDDGSPMRRRIRAAFDQMHDVADLSGFAIAELMRQSQIDIAIDLKGYTTDARTEIFCHRAAPIQVNYLGYPGSMGTLAVDYIIADPIVVPPYHSAFYAEKVVRLPDCYQVNDRKRAIAPTVGRRSDAGLPDDGLVFCCFNASYKISADVFDVWMRVLRDIDGSIIWLLADNEVAARALRREAAARGVAPDRLVFAERVPIEQHLSRHRLADLFLDTLPYNAHTTASDALWAGLPVVTCAGASFAGRVCSSLLHALNLDELITRSLADYEGLVRTLAVDKQRLSAIRHKLGAELATAPLFDTPRFCRNIEAAYLHMVELRALELGPREFSVLDNGACSDELTALG